MVLEPVVLAKLVSGYALGALRSINRLLGGTTQANYLVETSTGKFVVRLYPNRAADYVRFELVLLARLAAADFPCPQPVADAQGNLLGEHAGKPFAVFRYIEGERNSGLADHLRAAALVARMHSFPIDLAIPYAEHRERYTRQSCLEAAERAPRGRSADRERRDQLRWLEQQLAEIEMPPALPAGACHCDLNPSNFLYRKSVPIALLDFDMAARTCLLYDLANLLYWWANPLLNSRWQERARNLVAAYEAVRPLTGEERRHLHDALKLVFLMSVSWFIDSPEHSAPDRRGVAYLDALGRNGFDRQVFGGAWF